MRDPASAVTRVVWIASARHLLRHPAQLALALLGLALGVATITAVDIAIASSARAFGLSLEAVNGAATHVITGGPGGVDERLFAELAATTPYALAPIIEGYVTVNDETLELVGIDPLAAVSFDAQRLQSQSSGVDDAAQLERWIDEPGTVATTAATAQRLGIAVDGAFSLDIGGRSVRARLIETLPGEQAGRESLLVTDIAQAQEWLGLIGRLSRIDVRAPAGSAGDVAVAHLRAHLPAGVRLDEAQARSRTSLDMTAAFTANLRAMSLLALLVGLFLIYSAVSFAVVQRRRTLGVLRALGATRRQVLSVVLIEASVLGIVGGLLGLAAGVAMGRGLIMLVARTINDLYFVVTVNAVSLEPRQIIEALAAGLGAALVAAAVPAAEAAYSAPQLGMRRSALESRAARVSRGLFITSLALAAAASLIVGASGRSLFAGFAALFLLLLSVAALTPGVLRVAAAAAARLLGVSPVVRLAFADVGASLSRTGVAVAALGMAVAAMIGVSVMVESFRESLREWLTRTISADIYVSAPGPGFARPERRLEPEVVASLVHLAGVHHYSASRRVLVDSPRGPVALDALVLAPESSRGVQLVAGNTAAIWQEFARGAVIAAEPLAWRLQLKTGESLVLDTPLGPRSFPVAGIYREYGNDRGGVLMASAVYRGLWNDPSISGLGIYLDPGVNPDAMVTAMYAATSGRQALLIGSNAEVRALSMSIFERTFVVTRVLDWLAAGVAAVGLVSALLAWELEHAHDLAVLRSVGLTPVGTAVLIQSQTGFMGLVALLAAIPAGLATALLLVEVINRRAFGWRIDLHVHPAQLGSALALSLTAAFVAGIYPAWRSARIPIAAALREE
jgi:putative ABC transport system permease protein